jgi:hypothetical protein
MVTLRPPFAEARQHFSSSIFEIVIIAVAPSFEVRAAQGISCRANRQFETIV